MLLLLLSFSVVILLTHPPSAVALFVGIIALAVGVRASRSLLDYALMLAVPLLAFSAAIFWRYYPFLDLVVTEAAVFNEANRVMYESVPKRTFPVLLGLIPLAIRFRADRRDPLVLLFVGWLLVYAYGAATQQWAYGRVMPYMVLSLDMALAAWLVQWEGRLFTLSRPARIGVGLAACVLVAAELLNFGDDLRASLPGTPNRYSTYQFLTQYTAQSDVIATDLYTGWLVPTFGSKVIASPHPLAFVPDQMERRAAVERFFDGATSGSERADLIIKYSVNFILINLADENSAARLDSLETLGTVTYSDSHFVLIKLAR